MHIVLDRPQIPPNTGNISRLCAGTGTHLHLVGELGEGGHRHVDGRGGRFPLRRRAPDRVCALLPETDAGYLIVDLTGQYGEGDRAARPARVHLARAEGGGLQIVGLERPYELTPPGR